MMLLVNIKEHDRSGRIYMFGVKQNFIESKYVLLFLCSIRIRTLQIRIAHQFNCAAYAEAR